MKLLSGQVGFICISIFLLLFYSFRFLNEINDRQKINPKLPITTNFLVTKNTKDQFNQITLENERFQTKIRLTEEIKIGDALRLTGTLDNRLQSIYAYKIHLNSQSILLNNKKRSLGSFIWAKILGFGADINSRLRGRLSKILGTEYGELIHGMVFGGSNGIDADIVKQFKITGLSHVLTASGFNVSLFVSFSQVLFIKLRIQRYRITASIISLVFYTFLTGWSAPIGRAAVMAVFLLLAGGLGRPYSKFRSLFYACILMLIAQPFIIFSASFMMTVLATIGILFVAPVLPSAEIDHSTGFVFGKLWSELAQGLMTTIAVSLVLGPYMIYKFQGFSPISLLSNAILIWIVPILTIAGLVSGALLFMPIFVMRFILFPVWLLAEIFIRMVKLLSTPSFAYFEIDKLPLFVILIYYFCLFFSLVAIDSRRRKRVIANNVSKKQ